MTCGPPERRLSRRGPASALAPKPVAGKSDATPHANGPALPKTLHSFIALDILPGGTARAVTDGWPGPQPGEEAAWRWLHCDRTDAGFSNWSGSHLPAAVHAALIQAETRPRLVEIGDGLLVSLRGINLNPGQAEEDMVALRL